MTRSILIPHRDIIDYIKNILSPDALNRIKTIREKNWDYALLFQLIDLCKSKKKTPGNHKIENISFSDTEQILLNMLSGSYKPADAGHFLNLLTNSPGFYSRLILKLAPVKKLHDNETEDLSDIRVKPDDELLAEITAVAKSSRSFPGAAAITIFNKLKSLVYIKNGRQAIVRYSFVTVLLLLFSLVGYMALKPAKIRHEIYNKYFNNQTSALAYDSTLRGPLTRADQNTSYDTLLSQFKLGVGDYLRQNYTTALDIFEGILSRQDGLENDRFYSLLRETQFYSGISCLALAGETKFKKQQFLNKAKVYLLRAEELAEKYNLNETDREHFFLGLTYDLLGKKQPALEQLGQIPADSPYKSDGEKIKEHLIHKAVKH